MSNKKISANITSPKGIANWFKLVTPDPKFGKYSVDLILEDSPEVHQMIEKANNIIDATIKAEKEKLKAEGKPMKQILKTNKFPIKKELDANGEETGRFLIKLTAAARTKGSDKYPSKELAPPMIVSPANKVLTAQEKQGLRVLNGSIIRAGFTLEGYYFSGECGVSAKLKMVQIISLAEGNNGQASVNDFGFDVEGEELDFSTNDETVSSSNGETNDDF